MNDTTDDVKKPLSPSTPGSGGGPEESLPPTPPFEQPPEPPPFTPGSPNANEAIATVLAAVAYREPVSSEDGDEPTVQELQAGYIGTTTTILDLVGFDECLDFIPTLSPAVRLAIGAGALVLGFVLYPPPMLRKMRGDADTNRPEGGAEEAQKPAATP